MIKAQLQLRPLGGGVTGGPREFTRVPVRGEVIVTGNGRYVVTGVEWQLDGTATVIADFEQRAG